MLWSMIPYDIHKGIDKLAWNENKKIPFGVQIPQDALQFFFINFFLLSQWPLFFHATHFLCGFLFLQIVGSKSKSKMI